MNNLQKTIWMIAQFDGRVQFYDDERCCNQICRISSISEDELTLVSEDYQYDGIKFDEVKPILIPMSYFKEIVSIGGELICANDILMEKIGDTSCITNTMLVNSFTKWGFVQKLFELNFDVFSLIPNGLAISKIDIDNPISEPTQ